MFAWLDGPGENFRYPLPGSTNYLSAYDRRGRLFRDAATEPVSDNDLRPFPLNKHFISESVLSEPLRQEVWRRVQVEGKSVRTVSVELGIEMRRVGAVVRLVELERQMRNEVSRILATAFTYPLHDECQNRLVFQTSTMVIKTNKLQLSDCNYQIYKSHPTLRDRVTDNKLHLG